MFRIMFLDVFSFIYVHQLHFQFVLNVNSQIDKYTYDADDELSCELTLKVRLVLQLIIMYFTMV